MASLDTFYQNLLFDGAAQSTHNNVTLAHLFERIGSDISKLPQLDVKEVQSTSSLVSDDAQSSDACMQERINLVAEIKDAFKENVLQFNANNQHMKDLENSKASLRTLKSNIGNELRLINNLFTSHVQDDETNKNLEELYNKIVTDLDIYTCTGIMDIEKKIESISVAISKIKQQLQQGMDIFQCTSLMSGVRVCPICLNAEVKCFCAPCGHTFCESCVKGIKKCYMCRNNVQSVHKLYFT